MTVKSAFNDAASTIYPPLQFGAKLACAEVTAEALVMLWDFAIAQAASAIVAGRDGRRFLATS